MNLEDFRLSTITTNPKTHWATFFVPEYSLAQMSYNTLLEDVCAAVAKQCGCSSVKILSFEGLVDYRRCGHNCFIEFQPEEELANAGHEVEAVASEP